MPVYQTPGVYVEEIERGPRPIEGVPTNIAAFLGETERGPLRPKLLTSYNDYKRLFGGVFADGKYVPYTVAGFFENGGTQLYMCRIVASNATSASKPYGDFTVSAVGPGAWGNLIWLRIQDGTTKDKDGKTGFRLKLAYWSQADKATLGKDVYDPFED